MAKSKTVFITGGVGYIGGPTAYALSHEGYRVIVFDSTPLIPGIGTFLIPGIKKENCIFIQGDIRKKDELESAMRKYSPDIVIHLAALTSVVDSEKNKEIYKETNVRGTKNVLSAMTLCGCTKIIFASSASVYGLVNKGMSEDSALHPMNVYARTKAEGEKIIQRDKKIRWVILRYFNVVGTTKDGLFGEPIYKNQKLIPSAIRVATGGQKKLAIYGRDYETPDKTAIRDYVSLEDVVRANMKSVSYLLSFPESKKFRFREWKFHQIFNIGSGIGTSNLEVVLAVEKQLGKKIPMLFRKKRNEPVISVAKIERAKRMLGWEPFYSNIPGVINGLISFQKTPRRF
jgi:UDP-glucose 4-epimerase